MSLAIYDEHCGVCRLSKFLTCLTFFGCRTCCHIILLFSMLFSAFTYVHLYLLSANLDRHDEPKVCLFNPELGIEDIMRLYPSAYKPKDLSPMTLMMPLNRRIIYYSRNFSLLIYASQATLTVTMCCHFQAHTHLTLKPLTTHYKSFKPMPVSNRKCR